MLSRLEDLYDYGMLYAYMTTNLEVTKREDATKDIRAEGKVPGVVYGPKQEPISIAIDKVIFEKTLQAAGESTIITLKGLDEDIEVLIQDVAFDTIKGGASHVDLYAIERGKDITTNVALHFIGEAPVEKSGYTINKVLHEVEVTCRPSALPSHIDIDLSVLKDEDSSILVSDIVLPKDVTIETESDVMVANVAAMKEEEPEEEVEAVDMSAIEVEAKGKEESEEEDKE